MFTDLTEIIREALRDYPTEQPEGLAKILVDGIREKVVIRAYLQELLEARIKDVVRIDGNAVRRETFEDPNDRPPNWSPKFADRRSAWQAMLNSRVNIDGELKRVGSLTRDELVFCVQKRHALVEQIERQIRHFESMIDLLDRYRVATLDEVPEQE